MSTPVTFIQSTIIFLSLAVLPDFALSLAHHTLLTEQFRMVFFSDPFKIRPCYFCASDSSLVFQLIQNKNTKIHVLTCKFFHPP